MVLRPAPTGSDRLPGSDRLRAGGIAVDEQRIIDWHDSSAVARVRGWMLTGARRLSRWPCHGLWWRP